MSVYKRGDIWWVRFTRRPYGEIRRSSGSTEKTAAINLERQLKRRYPLIHKDGDIKAPFMFESDDYYLYVASQGSGLLKIGVSKDPDRRVNDISKMSGFITKLELSLLCINKPTARKLEKMLHLDFSKNRREGEWFSGISVLQIKQQIGKLYRSDSAQKVGTEVA